MPKQKPAEVRERAGYAIADKEGRITLCSVASNRHDAWQQFSAISREEIEEYKGRGFRCVKVVVSLAK